MRLEACAICFLLELFYQYTPYISYNLVRIIGPLQRYLRDARLDGHAVARGRVDAIRNLYAALVDAQEFR